MKPGHRVVIERNVAVAPERVYAAWTRPDLMARWLGDKVDADVRVGGRYRVENRADAETTYVHTGEYQVLEAPTRIVQSFAAGPGEPNDSGRFKDEFIEVRLEPVDAGTTRMTFINGWDGEAIEGEDREALETAWSRWLDRLMAILKTN